VMLTGWAVPEPSAGRASAKLAAGRAGGADR
jgi:hypothetical protein